MTENEPATQQDEPEATPPNQPKPFWRRPATIIVASVVVAGLLIGGGVAMFHPASSNVTACKLYEDAYNQMADAVRAKINGGSATNDLVRAETTLMPGRIQDAFDKATGDVAIKIRSSSEMATAFASDQSQDIGVAFFTSTAEVADACKADGAAIELHKMG